jgi:chemotaxis protein CheC
VTTQYSDLQLDALREVANIGSGTAATALSSLVGRSIDLTVPSASALPIDQAVEAVGEAEQEIISVLLPVFGQLEGVVLLVFSPESASMLCELLGVELDSEFGPSALGEIGNILGASYLGALSTMTGISMEPAPPQCVADYLAAVVSTALIAATQGDLALLLDSELVVEETECSFSFMFVPSGEGISGLLAGLGLAG